MYSKDIKYSDLVGTWCITAHSLEMLAASKGCNTYTNTSDHIITLRNDGMCRFSGFTSYSTYPSWCFKTEEKRYKRQIYSSWELVDSHKTGNDFVNNFDEQEYRYKIDIPRGGTWNEPIYIGSVNGELKIWVPLHNNYDGTSLQNCIPIVFEKEKLGKTGGVRKVPIRPENGGSS
jgi:hypothetical protein